MTPPYPVITLSVRKYIVLLLALSTGLVNAQRKPKIKGNRAVTEVQAALEDFHAITLLDDLEITLEKAAAPGYSITADDNLINVLKFEVASDTLYISSFYTITGKKQLDIKVMFADLSSLTVREGSVAMKEILNSDVVTVRTEGLARVQLRAKTAVFTLEMTGQSKGDFNLESDSLQINLGDRADVLVYQVSNSAGLNLKDNSDLNLEGTSDNLQLYMHGSASLRAERMEAGLTEANLSDDSSARLRAGKLVLSAGGTSKTYVYGNPEIIITTFRDASEIYKRTD
jgi:hypothetical protein